ncbi:MAG TPA: hypothetical protein VNO56_10005 [Gaiellaceae bacterium]|nr:hypothetical protein [Gaiellaceae bacterium]
MSRFGTSLRRSGRDRPGSERLTFEYDQAGVRLVRRTPRGKPAPPGDDLGTPPRADTLWAEVRSATGETLYRRTLRDAIPQATEVFEPEGRIRSVPYAPESGVFSVVLPVGPEADAAIVTAGPDARITQPGLRASPDEEGRPRELVRVSLRRG